MPILIAALWGGLIQVATTLLGRILIALGISWVTYTGTSALITTAEGYITSKMYLLPNEMVQFVAYMNLDKAMTMIFSAMVVSMTLRGLTNGTFSKMIVKAGR